MLAGVVLIQAAVLQGRLARCAAGASSRFRSVSGSSPGPRFGSGMGGYHLWTRFSGAGGASILDLLAGAAGNLVATRPHRLVLGGAVAGSGGAGLRRVEAELARSGNDARQRCGLLRRAGEPLLPVLRASGPVPALGRHRVMVRISPRVGPGSGDRSPRSACLSCSDPLVYIGFGPARPVCQHRRRSPVIAGSSPRSWPRFPETKPSRQPTSSFPTLRGAGEIYPFPGPMVCPESLIFHVERTSFPAYVAVEWEDAVPGVDWRAFLVGQWLPGSRFERRGVGLEPDRAASRLGELALHGGCSS